jgi:hypothetical protein
MATTLATRCILRSPYRVSSPSSREPCRRPTPPLRCSSPPVIDSLPAVFLLCQRGIALLIRLQVDAAPESAKGGEYRPSFYDDLLLAFFRSKMVEVSSAQSIHYFPVPVK